MTLRNYGAFYAALSGLFFGLLGYFGLSLINADISVFTMLFWRFLVSAAFIFILLIPQLKSLKISVNEIVKITLIGAVFYGGCSVFYFIAAQYIGSGLAMVIFFTYPSIVMLINFLFYRLEVSKIYYFALIIIFIGMLFLVNGGEFKFNFFGFVLSVLSAILYALYIIFSKNSRIGPLVSTFWISIGCTITSFISALIDHSFVFPIDRNSWFNILGIGIICTSLPIIFLLKGLKTISALQASLLSVLEPIFVVIFGIILLGEQINYMQLIGVTILLSGALISLLCHQNSAKKR